MNLRVIAGKHGGRKLRFPGGHKTHPMGERVRSAMFNSLGSAVDQAEVLDVFAGTGAIGLEAISRGAKHVTFIERDKLAQTALLDNISSLNEDANTKLIKTTVLNWLENNADKKFDLIFVDPPYNEPQFSTVGKLLGLLKPNGYMVLSHPGKGEVPTETGVVVVDNRSYGGANLTYYRREDV